MHDATWQLATDFVDSDGTKTKVWKNYILDKDILHQYH